MFLNENGTGKDVDLDFFKELYRAEDYEPEPLASSRWPSLNNVENVASLFNYVVG